MAFPPIINHIDRALFGFWSKEDIKKISVKHITEPRSFEKKTGAVTGDGLYSLALGPVKRFDICSTCGLNDLNCPGHYGHIELSVPVYHPMLVQTMYQIISKTCLECYRFRLSPPDLILFLAQLEALNNGFDHLVDQLTEAAIDIRRGEKDTDYISARLREDLNKMIEEEKSRVAITDCHNRPQQRSIVERLSKMFRTFIQGQLIKPLKTCPHCGERKQTTSLHQQISIVLGVQGTKSASIDNIGLDETELKIKTLKVENMHYLKTEDKIVMSPFGARYALRQLWCNEKQTMKRIFHFLNVAYEKSSEDEESSQKESIKSESRFWPTDLFFMDTILVSPAKFRPPMSQRGYRFEGPRTASLGNVMKCSFTTQDALHELLKETDSTMWVSLQTKLLTRWRELQLAVHCLYDNEMDRYAKVKYPGLKQLIDKKEGLFRKNMMGKRVNFAARSVISPDPNISVDQIGVPLVFAKVLTYPQPVTPWNIRQLKDAVNNGPHKYPGACSVTFDDGVTVHLNKESTRLSIAARLNSFAPRIHPSNSKAKQDTPQVTIIHRHLLTGDHLLFNRQPTLHKPSIMAFRARVLPNEKGFRLHYANCKSFNADFDGDEMNAHLPQSELARSEACNIVNVNHQYLVPKDGSPLGGLIQDHVVAPCIMTRRDQFYGKEQYHQLVFCALQFLDKSIKLEPPTIVKPELLWTGKQVITTCIKNCLPAGKEAPSLKIKAKVGPKVLNVKQEYESLSDCNVIISKGELLTGLMDKSNVGATHYGLIHTCYELYGGETSSNLMSAFARLSTWYLQLYEGFTLGIADILCQSDADEDRQQKIVESLTVGPESAKEALGLDETSLMEDVTEERLEDKLRQAHSDRDPLPMKKLDAAMKKRTDKISSDISARCLPDGLIRRFPDNNLQMMIQSGAKGGTVNALQISCLLGQIELEGRRVPLSMSGRSLPSFKPYDTSPKAGGFVSGRFLTGIQPQEFFFHCMAGREGLIDTAVKTSRSGYLQRCLIKHLEGLTVHYDQTVRDSCGSVVQFLYGEDGLDIVRSQMLKDKAYPLLVDNHKIIEPGADEQERLNKAKEAYEEDVITHTNEIQEWVERNGKDRVRKLRGSGFLDFQASVLEKPEEVERLFMNMPDFAAGAAAAAAAGAAKSPQASPKKVKSPKKDDSDVPMTTIQDEEANQEEDGAPKRMTYMQLLIALAETNWKKEKIREAWYSLSFKEKRRWNKSWDNCPDPLIALMNPGVHFGVVPEKLDDRIEEFIRQNPQLVVNPADLIGEQQSELSQCESNAELSKTLAAMWGRMPGNHMKPKMTKHEFYNLCYNLYMKMLAHPGEAVGLLAAQSIGEPSTQMTLNTFHFAGRGEMNVTLGIPRLREILMTASAKIGTPSMDLPLLPVMHDHNGEELSTDDTEQQAHKVRLALNAVRLSDVLEYVDITEETVNAKEAGLEVAAISGRGSSSVTTRSRKRMKTEEETKDGYQKRAIRYKFVFSFLPRKYYKHEYKTNTEEIMQFMEETFKYQLGEAIHKRQKRLALAESIFDQSTRKMSKQRVSDEDSGAAPNSAKGGAGSAAAGGGGGEDGQPGDDVDEKELDRFNEQQKARELARGAEEASSSEEDEEGENDQTQARLKNRQNADLDYEEAEDDDLVVADADALAAEAEENVEKAEMLVEDEPILLQDQQEANSDNDQEDEGTDAKRQQSKKAQSGSGKEKSTKHKYEMTITTELMDTRLDMGALIETEAKRTFIHRVGQIQRALIVKDVNANKRQARCELMIKTEGVSLLSLVRYSHILDLNNVYSNDIHAIARTYGIEAAGQVIRREMANVFAVYGIEVDSRHLSLIADYMTFNGAIRGMNRMSMEASASPFQQMSFESSIRYLKGAAILGLRDDIKSPSAALVFGRPTRGGTGLFTTFVDQEASNKSAVRFPPELERTPRSNKMGRAAGGSGEQSVWSSPQESIEVDSATKRAKRDSGGQSSESGQQESSAPQNQDIEWW